MCIGSGQATRSGRRAFGVQDGGGEVVALLDKTKIISLLQIKHFSCTFEEDIV